MLITHHKDYELIQRFFDFELNQEELKLFNERVEQDEAFANRVAGYLKIEKRISQHLDPEISEAALAMKATFDAQQEAPKSIFSRITPYKWLAAATIALVLGLSIWAIWPGRAGNAQNTYQLAEQYWQMAPKANSTVSRSTEAAQLSAIVQALRDKQAERALSLLEANDVLTENPNKVAMLKAEALFELAQYEQIPELMQGIIDHPENGYKDLALYYQAIAYLYLDNKTAAIPLLQDIVKEEYPSRKQAIQLLDQL